MKVRTALFGLAGLAIAAAPAAYGAEKPNPKQIERGRYLLHLGQCNDCHSHGFAPKDGNLPEKEWLLGSTLGFRGPWGTTPAPAPLTPDKTPPPPYIQWPAPPKKK